jgi:hypothetical protein
MSMGLKLFFLSWWTPKYFIRDQLTNVSESTTRALQSLLEAHSNRTYTNQESEVAESIELQRANMAETHVILVDSLAAAMGRELAVKLAREAMFSVGEELGKQARSRLGVGDSLSDLAQSVKVIYRILGIDCHLESFDASSAVLVIDRCPLSEHYSKLTCEVLSAVDEGVISGLHPKIDLQFKEYITSGCPKCKATIHLNQEETR